MKKIFIVSLITTTVLNASSIIEVLKEGKVSGQIRTAYVNQDNAIDTDTYGTSVGGRLKYETATWNNVTLGIAAYISEKLSFASGNGEKLNPDFFDTYGNSFVYLGEGYIDYSTDDVSVRIGRQMVDTPFMETDDVRFLPNSFEAAIVSYSGIQNTIMVAGYAQRWAGYDSPTGHNDSLNEFKKFGENHDSSGLYLVGITNESFEDFAVQGWLYKINQYSDIVYTDGRYTKTLGENTTVELNAQYALFNEDKDTQGNETGIDGHVYGVGIQVNTAMVTLGAAYNRTSNTNGKFISNGLGGGPYYTSMEEMTIDGLEDAKAYQVSAEIDMTDAGIEGLSVAALYGDFRGRVQDLDAKVTEFDVVAAYTLDENICADMSYAIINDKNKNSSDTGTDGGYNRFLVRLNYSF